jgi:D-glycero-alpha-D-manno-heptose-7-phosphate kinase
MKIVSQAPCRVDLAGATLDIWPLYLFHEGAVTVNFAVDRYTRASIEPRTGPRITIRSTDLNRDCSYQSLNELADELAHGTPATKHPLLLAAEVVRFFRPEGGFHLETGSDAPAGAGISGSSALMIAAVGAFNRWLGCGYSIEKLREIAQNIEARIIRVPTGCQDYYPAMYGGVSAIELGCSGIRRLPIGVDPRELESRVVLAYTGAPRNSGINNWEVMKAHIDGDRLVHRNFAAISAIAQAMREALSRADWPEVSRLIREDWTHRRRNAPGISTPLIDRLISATRRAGSTGAKVCGAGGGGCVLFLIEPDARDRVVSIIEHEGATVLPVKIARRGLRVQSSAKARAHHP